MRLAAAALALLVLAGGALSAGNAQQHVSLSSSGTTRAACSWALLVNTVAVSGAEDSLSLAPAPRQQVGGPRSVSASSERSASECRMDVREVRVKAALVDGFGTPPPAGGFSTPPPGAATLGNTFVLAGPGASGSAWSACQWLVAVNTVLVAPGAAPPGPGATLGAPRAAANATATSACAMRVENVTIEVG